MSGPSTSQQAGEAPVERGAFGRDAERSDASKPIASNDNAPLLDLHVVGDGRSFVQVLARSIVRRELIAAGLVPAPAET